jgi:tape measure domain-containing protein
LATESLLIRVDERGARVVSRNIDDIGKRSKTAGSSVGLLKNAIVALGASIVVRGLVRTADAFTNIQNRLRLVTESTGQLNAVQNELLQISNRTRSAFEINADLFNRLALSTRELGLTQRDVLQLTESLNQAVIISGASATEASAGLIQLSQGLASGALRGDELRSVLEQLPAVADVIAKELGVTRGELRTLGQEGKITAEIVTQAFANAREELNERFGKTVPTIAQGFQVLRNEFISFVGVLNQATGASGGLSRLLIGIGGFIRTTLTPAVLTFAESFRIAYRSAVDNLGGVSEVFDVLSINTSEVFGFIGRALSELPLNVATAIRIATVEIFGFFERTETRAKLFANAVAGTVNTILGRDEAVEANIQNRLKAEQELQNELRAIENERNFLVSDSIRQQNELRQAIEDRQTAAVGDVGSLDNLLPGGSGAAAAIAEIDTATKNLIQSQEDLLEQLLLEEQALVLAGQSGEDFNVVLDRLETEAIAAQTGMKGLAFDIESTREEIRRLRDEQARGDFLETLRNENEALLIASETGREVNAVLEEMAIRKQFLNDSEGLAEALDLTLANAQLRDQLKESEDAVGAFLNKARENAQDILGDALANAFSGGFDDLPGKFADVLVQLASQFLASEIFRLLGNLGQGGGGGGGGGGGAGGFLSLLGGFFGGGFANGGSFMVPGQGGPDSQLVSMAVTPRERVTVETPQQQQQKQEAPQVNVPVQVINVSDPNEIPSAMQSAAGAEVILNTIRRNPDAIRQIIG